jgi:hypothetical protein
MNVDRHVIRVILSLVFIGAVFITSMLSRTSFETLIVSYAIAFFTYLLILGKGKQWKWWLGVGVLARVILLFSFPGLSDDIYRFFWDGSLTLSGISPYSGTPMDLIGAAEAPAGLSTIFPLLNSPAYHTIYPPLCQLFFFLGALFSRGDIDVFVVLLKLIFLVCEGGSLWLLYRILTDTNRQRAILIYALNPLVLVELMGNLHFEALMILLMLATFRLLQKKRVFASAGLFTLAVATKILPLIILPFFWKRMDFKKIITFIAIVTILGSVLFLPIFIGRAEGGFITSLDLYFRRFEFNASLYYILRWMGSLYIGYNPIAIIGPLTAMIGVVLILLAAIRERSATFANMPLVIIVTFSLYFLCATTVHPWYLCTLIAFCCMTQMRYPIIWSGLAFLSYSAYRQDSTGEVLWLIALEYLVVGIWVIRDWPQLRTAFK